MSYSKIPAYIERLHRGERERERETKAKLKSILGEDVVFEKKSNCEFLTNVIKYLIMNIDIILIFTHVSFCYGTIVVSETK